MDTNNFKKVLLKESLPQSIKIPYDFFINSNVSWLFQLRFNTPFCYINFADQINDLIEVKLMNSIFSDNDKVTNSVNEEIIISSIKKLFLLSKDSDLLSIDQLISNCSLRIGYVQSLYADNTNNFYENKTKLLNQWGRLNKYFGHFGFKNTTVYMESDNCYNSIIIHNIIDIIRNRDDQMFNRIAERLSHFYDFYFYDKSCATCFEDEDLFNIFLNEVRSISSSNNDLNFDQTHKYSCYKMTQMIGLRYYFQKHNFSLFLKVFIELVLFNQTVAIDTISPLDYSFEQNIIDTLPSSIMNDSLSIIKRIDKNSIFDYFYDQNSQFFFILTSNGVFKIEKNNGEVVIFNELNNNNKVVIGNDNNLNIDDILRSGTKEKVKLFVSNGFLYLLCIENMTIYRKNISPSNEKIRREKIIKSKTENYSHHSSIEHPQKKKTKENENAKQNSLKRGNKITNKKLREKEKKAIKLLRKNERFNEEINDQIFNKFDIDIKNFPVISMGCFSEFIRIIQLKSRENDKITFIFTNIDLNPNLNNFNIEEVFSLNNESIKQTSFEFNVDSKFNFVDVLISKNSIFIYFENLSVKHLMIYGDGRIEEFDNFVSPFIFSSEKAMLKMDNENNLYNVESIENGDEFGISIESFNLNKLKYSFKENYSLFLKYPYLQQISRVVNQFVKRILNSDKQIKDEVIISYVDDASVFVEDPEKYYMILDQLEDLIANINDEDLKRFIASLLIKINGINLCFYVNQNDSDYINNKKEILKSIKKFIVNVYSTYSSNSSFINDVMLRESMIFTTTIFGKFLFLPDETDKLRNIVKSIVLQNELYSNAFSFMLFAYPSTVYFIDDEIVMKFGQELNISELFINSISYIQYEIKFLTQIQKEKCIELIFPYIEAALNHIKYAVSNDLIQLSTVEKLLSLLFTIDSKNIQLSLLLEKKLVEISPDLFIRIKKINGIYENDKESLEQSKYLDKIEESNKNWIPNEHLFFYNYFISFLLKVHSNAFSSTKLMDIEKDFRFILDDELIQGIKIEEIENYEKTLNNVNSANPNIKKISRGISRGISYNVNDEDEENNFDEQTKKIFLNSVITLINNQNNNSKTKRLFDFLYSRTKRQCLIRINPANEWILEYEYYLAACLFKQLGFINQCIKLQQIVQLTPKDSYNRIKVSKPLLSLMKLIYKLRSRIASEHHKSIGGTSNIFFANFLKEIKLKCKLLLYSNPILKLKNIKEMSDDQFESTKKSIFSFVISKIPLSKISNLIDIRTKRLSYSIQSLSTLLSFLDQNLLFESTKSIFEYFYSHDFDISRCKGVTQKELKEFDRLSELFALSFIRNIYSQIPINSNMLHFSNLLLNFESDDKRIQCSQLLIDKLNSNVVDINSFFYEIFDFNIVINLILIAIKTKNENLINFIFSLVSNEKIDVMSKKLINIVTPIFVKICNIQNIYDESFINSFIENNRKSPIIIQSSFYWIASVFNKMEIDESKVSDFILKVLKGIGQSFTGKSCLFIDDSFQPLAHRQVSEKMVSFIRVLFNSKNKVLYNVIHAILREMNKDNLNDYGDSIYTLIGLFSSLGQTLTSFEADRKITKSVTQDDSFLCKVIDPMMIELKYENEELYSHIGVNNVYLHHIDLNLNETEINNILHLHENIMNSGYFNNQSNYENVNINERIFITTFYSFLPILMQNQRNASLLLNDDNINKSLSLFSLSQIPIPSNTNSLIFLSHYLEQAVINPPQNLNENTEFLKMSHGEIVHQNGVDIIKSDYIYKNLFMCNRPFGWDCETYFEVKINKIGRGKIFIGCINSEEITISNAFGFDVNNINRRNPNDLSCRGKSTRVFIQENDVIGCYYTSEFVYLTVNGKLTQYRHSHESLQSYIPIILIEICEVKLEIRQNVTIVDISNERFSFLRNNLHNEDYFKEKDDKYPFRNITGLNVDLHDYFIGGFVRINEISLKYLSNRTFSYSQEIANHKEYLGIIRDVIPIKESTLYFKLKVEVYNYKTFNKEIINIDSRQVSLMKTTFLNLIENRTNSKLSINSSFDLKSIPQNILQSSGLNSYVKNKIIIDNSKSISIIMTRYLVQIMVDYLRYSKSNFLKENIDSNEAKIIIKSLAYSLLSTTRFLISNSKYLNKSLNCLIFTDVDDNKIIPKMPGQMYSFTLSFIAFLQNIETIVSPNFLNLLIRETYEIVNSRSNSVTCSSLYYSIHSRYKIESFYPLPKEIEIKKEIEVKDHNSSTQGYIPILMKSIDDEFPSVTFFFKNFRKSTNECSYFLEPKFNESKITKLRWACKRENENINYKLQFAVLQVTDHLPENILFSQFGLIKMILSILNVYYNIISDSFKHDILSLIFSLNKNNPIISPFVRKIAYSLISTTDRSILFNDDELITSLISISNIQNSSNKLYKMQAFPFYKNESDAVFNIYSVLSYALKHKDDADIYEFYHSFCNELLDVSNSITSFEEGYHDLPENRKYKNYRIFYLLYYYSLLLNNKNNLAYPKFLFVNEFIRQKFGEFSFNITYIDIKKYNLDGNNNDNEIIYKSKIFVNDNDLDCTCKIIGNFVPTYSYSICIQQVNGGDDIPLNYRNGTSQQVSFPLCIIIKKNNRMENKDVIKLLNGAAINFNFKMPYNRMFEFYNNNRDNIEEAFQQFIAFNDDQSLFNEYLESIIRCADRLISDERENSSLSLLLHIANEYRRRRPEEQNRRQGPEEQNRRRRPEEQNRRQGPEEQNRRQGPEEQNRRRRPEEQNRRQGPEEQNRRQGPEEQNRRQGPEEQNRRQGPEEQNRRQEREEQNRRQRPEEQNRRQRPEEQNRRIIRRRQPAGVRRRVPYPPHRIVITSDKNEIDNYDVLYDLDKILTDDRSMSQIKDLRCSILSFYCILFEKVIYHLYIPESKVQNMTNFWNSSFYNSELSTIFNQILLPLYSMKTQSKFSFINIIIKRHLHRESCAPTIEFNRIEKQRFFDKFDTNQSSSIVNNSNNNNNNSDNNRNNSDNNRNNSDNNNNNNSDNNNNNSDNNRNNNSDNNNNNNSDNNRNNNSDNNNNNNSDNNNNNNSDNNNNNNSDNNNNNSSDNNNGNDDSIVDRPLLIQFMQKISVDSISCLRNFHKNPFSVKLLFENPIDLGGPGREIFSDLIIELMNHHLGIFTSNPNNLHCIANVNKEDLIPNKFYFPPVYSGKNKALFSERFYYAGSLMAICIVSNLSQPLYLSSIVWDYLTSDKVNIESIYEIDEIFKRMIQNAESLLDRIDSITDEEFKESFSSTFEITDSFDNKVELIPNGSRFSVNKQNLSTFINLAKNYRIHEFDKELLKIKKGFTDFIDTRFLMNILSPKELKLFVCGNIELTVNSMKRHFKVTVDNREDPGYGKSTKNMFWNVMESLSVDYRRKFIKFASGNMGLPPPGQHWNSLLKVSILNNRSGLPIAHTCFSEIEIGHFESEEELLRTLQTALDMSGDFGFL